MIKIEHVEVVGLEHAIRGMRNPMNSWDRSDSGLCQGRSSHCETCWLKPDDDYALCYFATSKVLKEYVVGPNDLELMRKLADGGSVHAKYRRMIVVYMDITAPLYWWKEFDTYKVGTVANSCSTMHKIADKEFTLDDFSHEHLFSTGPIDSLIETMNHYREMYVNYDEKKPPMWGLTDTPVAKKDIWWQMIQLLPSSYNQKRTVMLNYEVLAGIYKHRKGHKLDEWCEFCKWIESLPMNEIITDYYVTKLSAANEDSKDIVLGDGSVSIEEVAFAEEYKDDPIVKAVTDEANMSKSKPKLITEMTVAELFEDFENQRHIATLEDYLYQKIEEAANAKEEEKANDEL